jgi:large subunit ribosomal protein L2
MTGINFRNVLTASEPEKTLVTLLPKHSGRDQSGHISSRHIGGRQTRLYRTIDFRRDKYDVSGRVLSVEYDPNRNANIALIQYPDGQRRYILHPETLKVGDQVISTRTSAEIRVGNSLPLSLMPIGTVVHNLELSSGQGGVLVRGAGTGATILAKEGDHVTVRLPSGETRIIHKDNVATVGVVGNLDYKNVIIGKAGRNRHMGLRPRVRGTAQNPRTHPHGGGEGRSGIGLKNSKTPWGKPARGLRTRKDGKYSDQYILERRKKR